MMKDSSTSSSTDYDRQSIRARFDKVNAHANGTGAEAANAKKIRAKMLEDHPWLSDPPPSAGTGSTRNSTRNLADQLVKAIQGIGAGVIATSTAAAEKAAIKASAKLDRAIDAAIDQTLDAVFSNLAPEVPMAKPAPSSRRAPARMSVAAIMDHVSFSGRILSTGDGEGEEAAIADDDPVAVVLWIDQLDFAEALADKASSTESVAKKLGKLLVSTLIATVDGKAPGDCDLWEWLGEEEGEEEGEE
jgi:hypothetical protein